MIRGQLNYQQTFSGIHQVNALAGAEIRERSFDEESALVYGYNENTQATAPVDYASYFILYGGRGYTKVPTIQMPFKGFLNRFVSYFANASYSYDNRYVLSLSARRDAANLLRCHER